MFMTKRVFIEKNQHEIWEVKKWRLQCLLDNWRKIITFAKERLCASLLKKNTMSARLWGYAKVHTLLTEASRNWLIIAIL
jgi:hypothetical protein